MTDVTSAPVPVVIAAPDEAAAVMLDPVTDTLDEAELAEQLLAKAKADGVSLVGPGGLLSSLTKKVLETALNAEGGERLGYVLGHELVAATVLVTGVTALGDAIRSRRQLAREAAERVAIVQRQREAEAKRQVEQERSRIAREVHDVVAHTVSAIAIHADVAAEAIGDDEQAVAEAIDNIRRTSRQAVKELRAALDVLHAGTMPETPRHPVAGLADLPRIVETAATSGLAVALSVNGDSRPVPLIVDTAAQRIIQESITNTMRHAKATNALIELDYRCDQLVVRIADNGNGNGARHGNDQGMVNEPGTGQYGIRGMRERANLLGGSLRTEPAPDGGFVVEAVLPLQEQT